MPWNPGFAIGSRPLAFDTPTKKPSVMAAPSVRRKRAARFSVGR
jgi:hypothetical protein